MQDQDFKKNMGYLKIPYLTTAERMGYTPDAHELLYDTNLNSIWYGDGVTVGGKELVTGVFVVSVTGLNTDNTDPQNPIVQISVDGVTITGDGTPGNPLVGASSVTSAALTKVDDTNVTLTLGGTPASALLQAVTLTLGWTGTLADGRIASAATWNAKQTAYAILSALGLLANAPGILTNDGAGNLSWVPDAGGESLAVTLGIGNTTGGNHIIISAADEIQGSAGIIFLSDASGEVFISAFTKLNFDTPEVNIGVAGATTGLLHLHNSGNTNYVGFTAPNLPLASYVLTMPLAAPTSYGYANAFMTSNGSGTLSWTDVATIQVAYAILTTLGSLANASGVLTNDGSGNLSWGPSVTAATTAEIDAQTDNTKMATPSNLKGSRYDVASKLYLFYNY